MSSNHRLLDRLVTPDLMGTALRIAQLEKPNAEARHLLEIALRDHVDSKTGRRKTATILAGSWLNPAQEASSVVTWALEHVTGDVRMWHFGVLMANYSFLGELCEVIGRNLGLSEAIDTTALRSEMKTRWGDRDVVNVATRSAIRTLRAFGILTGEEGDSESAAGERFVVEPSTFSWLIHVLLVHRGVMEIDTREIARAPELFMFDLPSLVPNGYPHLERFTEGGGRVVLRRVVAHNWRLPPTTRQMELGI